MLKYLTALAALLPISAYAQDQNRGAIYLGGSVGIAQPFNSDLEGNATVPFGMVTGNAEVSHSTGFLGCVVGGYDMNGSQGFPVRIEAEGCVRRLELDRLDVENFSVGGPSVTGIPTFDIAGKSDIASGLANVWFDWHNDTSVVPYIGGGVGYARINTDVDRIAGITINTDDTDGGLAWQIGAGFSVPVTDAIDFTAGYRYFQIQNPKYSFDGAVGAIPFSADVNSEYADHNVQVGVRYRF